MISSECYTHALIAPGTIPPELGTMDRLNWLRFADNGLEGSIPEALKATAPHLSQLQIGDNNFEGVLIAQAAAIIP